MTLARLEFLRQSLPHRRPSALLQYLSRTEMVLPEHFGAQLAADDLKAELAEWVRSPLRELEYPDSGAPDAIDNLTPELSWSLDVSNKAENERTLYAASLLIWLWSGITEYDKVGYSSVILNACSAARALGSEAVAAFLEFIASDHVWTLYSDEWTREYPAFDIVISLLMNTLATEWMRQWPDSYCELLCHTIHASEWADLEKLISRAGIDLDLELLKLMRNVKIVH